jgi:hypothetical protein
MTTWRKRITCWLAKATNTPSEYIILIVFQRQQWLRERASVLDYTYIVCLVIRYGFVGLWPNSSAQSIRQPLL